MRKFFASVLYVLSCVLLAVCMVLLLLTLALVSSQAAVALRVAPAALTLTKLLPAPLAFWGVLASPLGGVFRTDFVLAALACFVAAKVSRRIGKALK